MVISALLTLHIILAVAVLGGFVARYMWVFRHKEYPEAGRRPLFAGSALLVGSGIALSIVGHVSLTSFCLSSLSLIISLILLELGLQKLSSKLAHAKAPTK